MSGLKAPFSVRVKASALGIVAVLLKPMYLLIVFLGAILSSSVVMWSLNLDLVRYIIFEAPISALSKLQFFTSVYSDVFLLYSSVQVLSIAAFSVLFGINLALIVYALNNHSLSNIPKKSGLTGFIAAILGGGCVACGTSILAPLLVSVGGVSSALVADISAYLMWVASLMTIYSVYKLGMVISTLLPIRTQQTLKNNKTR